MPFATDAPSPQATIDLLDGWVSRVPGVKAGRAELFTDSRVEWAIETLGGVGGARCLELGPLEGGHSYMLETAGAQVTAVEANKNAYLKCLIVKELLGLQRCSFLLGDVVEYLKASREQFDVCWCAGILYHLTNPVELIDLISQHASRLYMWTHYYDATKGSCANAGVSEADHAGYRHQLHRQEYGAVTEDFCGGVRPYSHWLTLDGILGALGHFGWDVPHMQLAEHSSGPCVNLVATRSS